MEHVSDVPRPVQEEPEEVGREHVLHDVLLQRNRKHRVVIVYHPEHLGNAEGVLTVEDHEDSLEEEDEIECCWEVLLFLLKHLQPVIHHTQQIIHGPMII